MDRTLNPLPHLPRPTKTYHRALYDRIRPDRPELSVKGKTVMVTGAAGGVGSAVCNAFAKAGIARISAVGRTLKSLEKLKEDIEARHPETKVTPHVADMTDHVAIGAAVRKSGKIDFVVNVAVFVHDVAPPSHVNHEQVVKCFETNTFGPLNLVKCILAEREFKGYTHDMKFIYISTALSHTSVRRLTGYAASKAAFNHFIKDLSAQWKDRGIHFFSCHPGLFFTEIMKKLWLEHEIVWDDAQLPGAFCVWLCSPEASFLSGKMTWAQWDVDELLAKKEWVEKEDYNLEIGVNAPPDAEDNKDPWDAEP